MILRVGHLRDCEYELQQHRRLARTRGIGPDLQAKIFEGPDADGLTDRQRALITATDEFVITRGVSPETWATAVESPDPAQLIEFCMLAATIRRARGHHHDAACRWTSRTDPVDEMTEHTLTRPIDEIAFTVVLSPQPSGNLGRRAAPRGRDTQHDQRQTTGDIGRAHRNAAHTSDLRW